MNENDRKWNKEGRYATLVYEYMLNSCPIYFETEKCRIMRHIRLHAP